jgi:3-deoxy-D-manno-octulosonic acid kinase
MTISAAPLPPPEKVPPGFIVRRSGGVTLVVQDRWDEPLVRSRILTGTTGSRDARAELTGGRGSVSVHALPGAGDVALRRYRRGGLIGKILIDRYLSGSRPLRELRILALAAARGVPVPEVVGASSIRAGLIWHRGRIATRLIPDSVTLPVFVGDNRNDTTLLAGVLERAGSAIRLMHDAGIDHADLNMNNLLVGGTGAVFIIDFDKATAHPGLGRAQRIRNLRRLLRSLRKLRAAGRPVEDDDFSMIIKGYAGDDRALIGILEKATIRSRLLRVRSAMKGILRINARN